MCERPVERRVFSVGQTLFRCYSNRGRSPSPLAIATSAILYGANPILYGANPILYGANPTLYGANPILYGARTPTKTPSIKMTTPNRRTCIGDMRPGSHLEASIESV